MDPITQRILDNQRAIQENPTFANYTPSGSSLDQDLMNMQNQNNNGLTSFNTSTPVNESINFMPDPNPDYKSIVKDVSKKIATDYAIKKLGLEGIKGNIARSVIGGNALSFSNPIGAALTVGSLLPDSVRGIAGILRGKRATKAIEKDIMRDTQGTITTVPARITNMQPTAQDLARGNQYNSPPSTPSPAPSRPARHTSGPGGLHSGY